ncbi:hypothetical protein K9N68_38580 (plasmid) [Kovacikia minuta CCNUW1]|uniref:Swt1 family HEPN domain-containing protein n=1 Tax=Kovacikia minuta TaxID=2931930 RepID=UPI001CCDF7C7|nr:Swt1 family HEPN domain-containing protein [Kovacikia minuta]UBF30092.1 hypothetical protein K9N68_38580 [Kovacikia minuta CCNUW1]
MSISNHERVGRALNLLKEGLYPYIEREMKAVYKDKWLLATVPHIDPDNTLRRKPEDILKEDVMAQLKLMPSVTIWMRHLTTFKLLSSSGELLW